MTFVGASEAGDILGFGSYKISRWKEAGKLPPLVADLRSTPVWLRADIEALARGEEVDPSINRAYDIVGLGEAAETLRMDKSALGRLRRQDRFVEPLQELRAGPIWLRETVRQWAGLPAATVA